MGYKGINIRQSGGSIIIRESLKDSSGNAVTTGVANLRLYQLQSNGSLFTYDFNNNTFTSGAVTTPFVALTQQTGNNGTVNTGIWTYVISTVTGFTVNNIIISSVNHPSATPASIEREFQFGGCDGDQTLSLTSYTDANLASIVADATSPTRLKNLFTAVQQGTVDTSTSGATTTQFETSFTANTNLFIDQALYFFSGTNAGYTSAISAYTYTGNNKVQLTLSVALQSAPANLDGFLIMGKVL